MTKHAYMSEIATRYILGGRQSACKLMSDA